MARLCKRVSPPLALVVQNVEIGASPLADLAPGNYRIEALEYSSEDGSLFAKDDKQFIVK